MGFKTIVTPEDLLATEGLAAGWYPAEIISYEEAITKGTADRPSDGSTNAIYTFKLIDGPGKGREFKRYFNEKPKSMAFAKALWNILFGQEWKKSGISDEMMKAKVGSKLQVYIKKDKDGKFDNIDDYRPL